MKKKLTMKEWRKLLGFSQDEVAKQLGIHMNTLREYEAHPEMCRVGTLITFCDVLGININDLKIF